MQPPSIANGRAVLLQQTNEVGQKIHYKCDENYQLSHNTPLECVAKRRWQGTPPTCSRIPCKSGTVSIAGDGFAPCANKQESLIPTITTTAKDVEIDVSYICQNSNGYNGGPGRLKIKFTWFADDIKIHEQVSETDVTGPNPLSVTASLLETVWSGKNIIGKKVSVEIQGLHSQ